MAVEMLAASILSLVVLAHQATAATCVVPASGTNATDDAPAITDAFEQCGQGGTVVFAANTTYYVNSVMNVTRLQDVLVDIQGTLLVSPSPQVDCSETDDPQWSTDIQYWLKNSLDVGYQNQSTAWILGGDSVRIQGHGTGTLNGNGKLWSEHISEQENTSNYPGRPHAITFHGLNNSHVEAVNFVQSQMWVMSIIYSHNVTLGSIFVNNTGLGCKFRPEQGSSGARTEN